MKRQAIEPIPMEETNEQASTQVADLALAGAKASEIKAGGAWRGPILLASARVDGTSASNHNETVAEDEATTPAPLADLPVEDGEQIKGGDGAVRITSIKLEHEGFER